MKSWKKRKCENSFTLIYKYVCIICSKLLSNLTKAKGFMRIWKILFMTLVLILLTDLSSAQKTGPVFLDKKHQHSISAEVLAFSYSYAHRFKCNVVFGVSATNGFSFQVLLASSPIQNSSDPDEYDKPYEYHFEFLKFQFFYRFAISNRFYIDWGPFVSIPSPMDDPSWGNPSLVGIEVALYVMVWKLHIGLRFKVAMSFDSNFSYGEKKYYALYIMPLVIGLGF